MSSLNFRAFRSAILGTLTMAAFLFIPAWTLDYWQAWAFMATYVGSTAAITIYLAKYDPKLLERRMRAGPRAEKEKSQKIIMLFAVLGFAALLIYPALDYRFGWSPVPASISILGDTLVALGFLAVFFVFRANSYGASTIEIAEGQKVISTGPYAIVRHPMYAGALPLLIGAQLALGAWWGLFLVIPFIGVLIWRLLDEEKFLAKNLAGYLEYTNKVRYRLIPFIW